MKRLVVGAALAVLGSMASANATTVWTNWTASTTNPVSGSATGTLGGNIVNYSGEMECLNCFASNWSPATTWEGGPVTSPPPDNSGIQLFGGQTPAVIDTLTFTTPMLNPVLAIVSLGQGGDTASFNFSNSFTLLGGGPSTTWGGQALTSSGDVVFGTEGNGLVLFKGTFSSISWTNPTREVLLRL